MKIFVRIIIDAMVIIFALVIITGWRALVPPRMPISLTPQDYGLPYKDVMFETQDSVRLKGWFIHSEKSQAVIICLHGYPGNKSDILPALVFLYPEFSLLFFDFRAHGESEGRYTYFGLKEFLDVEAAIRHIKNNENLKDKKIGLWGYSMGGAVGIKASSEYKNIDAIVTDSAFANFPEMIIYYYKQLGPLKYIFGGIARVLGRAVLKSDFIQNSPEYAIGNIKCPILIIHSVTDDFVPYTHAERLFEKAPEPKELMEVKGDHSGLDRAFTEEYQSKVSSFFSSYLSDTNKNKEHK